MTDDRGQFEVHLTARTDGPAAAERFADWCQGRGFKCVRIVLSRGESADQPMATWRRRDTLAAVRAEAEQVAAEASAAGVTVTRLKIEADPHNVGVPQTDADPHPPGGYFEHHAKLRRPTDAPAAELLTVCERHAAHLSRNAFRDGGDWQERFVTQRAYAVGRATAAARLDALLAELHALGEAVVECESEYCVYDTNLRLDAGWLPDPTGMPT